jgi:hypothetical protein
MVMLFGYCSFISKGRLLTGSSSLTPERRCYNQELTTPRAVPN